MIEFLELLRLLERKQALLLLVLARNFLELLRLLERKQALLLLVLVKEFLELLRMFVTELEQLRSDLMNLMLVQKFEVLELQQA